MDRSDKRMDCLEKLCATESKVAEPGVVAVIAPHHDAPVSRPGVQGSRVIPTRKKLPEFDGRVSWEAYRIRFEMLADQNKWD